MENPQYYREDEVDAKFNEKLVSSVNIKTINGSSILGAGNLTINSATNYKVYVALLTQTGTNAPTAIVLENTLGGTVVWTRQSQGSYYGTLNGVFSLDKTTCFMQGNSLSAGGLIMNYLTARWTDNSVFVNTSVIDTTPTAQDALLTKVPIEIRVYNSEETI